jgi:hypothetical protein
MTRPNDPFWDHVEKLDDGRFNCKFCGYKFAAAASVTMIKWHLSGVQGRGVTICRQVQNLKRGSSLERPSINQADEPRGDSSPPKDLLCLGLGSYHDQLCSPSAKNDVIMDDVQNIFREKTEPVASMLEQSYAILNKLAGDDGRIQVGVQAIEQGAEEELICSHPEAGSGMENTCEGFIQHVDRNVSPGKLFVPHRLFFFLSYHFVFHMELLFESLELGSLIVSINWSFLVYIIHALWCSS